MSESAMRKLLSETELKPDDFRPYVTFSPDCYTRNRITIGSAYELLVLGWRSGQRSPIHDHRGSNCALKVVQGIATEVTFHRSPCGLVSPSVVHDLHAGDVTASRDDEMHQMGNLQAKGDLVTLHLYSPPLRKMGTYFLGDSVVGEFENPRVGLRVARTTAGMDERARIIQALRRARRKISRMAGVSA